MTIKNSIYYLTRRYQCYIDTKRASRRCRTDHPLELSLPDIDLEMGARTGYWMYFDFKAGGANAFKRTLCSRSG